MDAQQIAAAAREVASDLDCGGYEPHEPIARAFEKFADLIDPRDG